MPVLLCVGGTRRSATRFQIRLVAHSKMTKFLSPLPDILRKKFLRQKGTKISFALRATCDQLFFSTKAAGRSVGPEIITLTGTRHALNMSRLGKEYCLVRRVLLLRSERSIRLLAQ
jgi:hypothetical protein